MGELFHREYMMGHVGILSNRKFHRTMQGALKGMDNKSLGKGICGRIFVRSDCAYFYYLEDHSVYRFFGATARKSCLAFLGARTTGVLGNAVTELLGNHLVHRNREFESFIRKDQVLLQERKIIRLRKAINDYRGELADLIHSEWCICSCGDCSAEKNCPCFSNNDLYVSEEE